MLRDRDTEALWGPVRTAVLQQNVLRKSLDKQTTWNYLQYYCLLNLTLQWHWQFWRNVIWSVQVLVKAVGVKLLKVFSTEITVFSVTQCSSADTALDRNRPKLEEDKEGGCGSLYWLLGWD